MAVVQRPLQIEEQVSRATQATRFADMDEDQVFIEDLLEKGLLVASRDVGLTTRPKGDDVVDGFVRIASMSHCEHHGAGQNQC